MVKNNYYKRLLSLIFTTLYLGACSVAPIAPVEDDLARLPVPAAWTNAESDARQAQQGNWWQHYRDPELDRLMQQALSHNQNLSAAILAWRESLLAVDSRLAQQAPQYSGDIGARASRDIKREQNSHSFSANLAASYQLDLWRKHAAQHVSAQASADASGEDYLAARLALSGQLAKAYFQLRYLDDQLDWNRRFLDNSRTRLARTRIKFEAGSLSELELLQEQQSVTNLERERQNLEGERRKAENSLAVLLGVAPQRLTLGKKNLDDIALPDIPAGLPAHLLARRPDLRAAQYRLQAALADIAVAERDFYPDIALTANLGSSSQALIRLLQNPVAGIGASLSLPFLQYREREIALLRNQIGYRKNLKDFERALYQALTDVENALISRDTLKKEADILHKQLRQQQKIENLTDIRYQAGAAALQDALDAKNSREQAQSALLANRLNQLNASIDLYLALGGSTE